MKLIFMAHNIQPKTLVLINNLFLLPSYLIIVRIVIIVLYVILVTFYSI